MFFEKKPSVGLLLPCNPRRSGNSTQGFLLKNLHVYCLECSFIHLFWKRLILGDWSRRLKMAISISWSTHADILVRLPAQFSRKRVTMAKILDVVLLKFNIGINLSKYGPTYLFGRKHHTPYSQKRLLGLLLRHPDVLLFSYIERTSDRDQRGGNYPGIRLPRQPLPGNVISSRNVWQQAWEQQNQKQ